MKRGKSAMPTFFHEANTGYRKTPSMNDNHYPQIISYKQTVDCNF